MLFSLAKMAKRMEALLFSQSCLCFGLGWLVLHNISSFAVAVSNVRQGCYALDHGSPLRAFHAFQFRCALPFPPPLPPALSARPCHFDPPHPTRTSPSYPQRAPSCPFVVATASSRSQGSMSSAWTMVAVVQGCFYTIAVGRHNSQRIHWLRWCALSFGFSTCALVRLRLAVNFPLGTPPLPPPLNLEIPGVACRRFVMVTTGTNCLFI